MTPRAGAAHRLAAALVPGLLAVLLGACITGPMAEKLDPELYQWPPQDPRIQLQRVVALRRDAESNLRGFLGGKRDEFLFERPYGVAWDGDDLLVTDPGAGAVLRLGANRKVLRSQKELSGPIGVASCADGIVVTDARSGGVALLDAQLRFVRWLARGLVRPTGVACTGGRTYVVETGAHRLLRMTEDGYEVVTGGHGDGPGQTNFPAALAVHRDGLWLGDTLNFRVQHLAADGTYQGDFGQLGDAAGETPRIKGIAVDLDGHLWISDAVLDQVAVFETSGTFLMSLGRRGQQPGEFSFPAGIAAHPDGRVAVVDSINRRLQVFRVLTRPDATERDK